MAYIVTAPQHIPNKQGSVYLAGAIDMGMAENWQRTVIDAFRNYSDIVLINPRRSEFRPEMEDEQISWELMAMENAQYILMWFPKDAEAPISFLEFGLYLKSGKLFVGVEEGFYRQRNLELTAQRYYVPIFHSLKELIEQVTIALGNSSIE